MAGTTTQQGTGKHPHKSAAEPEPHHEAPTTKGKDHEASHASSASNTSAKETHSGDQGTGKHPHKSAEHPEPVHEAPTTKGEGSHSSGSHASSGTHKESNGSPSAASEGDLQSRAYTGPDGQEHHHTKAYMEQHKGEK